MSNATKQQLKAVAENVREIRLNKNLTQAKVADKLSISQNAYSKIELQLTKLTVERLFQIAEILDVDPADFLAERKLGRRITP